VIAMTIVGTANGAPNTRATAGCTADCAAAAPKATYQTLRSDDWRRFLVIQWKGKRTILSEGVDLEYSCFLGRKSHGKIRGSFADTTGSVKGTIRLQWNTGQPPRTLTVRSDFGNHYASGTRVWLPASPAAIRTNYPLPKGYPFKKQAASCAKGDN
jgi:hypothetical protein